jgi:hypothetical protein
MRKDTISLPDCPVNMVILTLFLKMEGDEQVFAGKTVAVKHLKKSESGGLITFPTQTRIVQRELWYGRDQKSI